MFRTEDVGSNKSCINVDRIAQDRWGPPLVDADWLFFCQAFYKSTEGTDWEDLYDHYREMSRAASVNESQKSESHLENQGSQGQRRGIL